MIGVAIHIGGVFLPKIQSEKIASTNHYVLCFALQNGGNAPPTSNYALCRKLGSLFAIRTTHTKEEIVIFSFYPHQMTLVPTVCTGTLLPNTFLFAPPSMSTLPCNRQRIFAALDITCCIFRCLFFVVNCLLK